MDNLLSVLLIEDEPSECKAFVQYIDSNDKVHLVGVTNNTDKALDLVNDYLPDAIILDLELHKGSGNGISFLIDLNREHVSYRPFVLVTTNNISAVTHAHARQLGADFVMVKSQADYCAESVIDFLLSLREVIHSSRMRKERGLDAETPAETKRRLLAQVTTEINLIGISPKAVGRNYIIDAIMLVIDDQRQGYITSVAQKYGKTDASVERAMQNAINGAWRSTDIEDLQRYYTARVKSTKGVPTLTEFIFYYANKLHSV